MTSLSHGLASCARQAALEQRARLLDAVWADVHDETRSLLHTMLPRRFMPKLSDAPGRLDEYAVDLGYSPDGVWRVIRDRTGSHPGAPLLEAPVLAVFLPGLCRQLLGESLLMSSMPVWWLGDRATLNMLAARPTRFCLRDGFDPESAPITLAGLSPIRRRRLQLEVDRRPQRFVATLDLDLPLQHCNVYHRPVGMFASCA